MERSLQYYVDGLGFSVKTKWVVDEKVRWCWLELGGAALMLQEFFIPSGKLGRGHVAVVHCEDALAIYDQFRSRSIDASEPQVGNGMWVTTLSDPDGYSINFESATDTPEEARLSEVRV